MAHSRHCQQPLSIVSYYYDIFSGKRMLREMIEMTMIESSSSIEGDSSMLNSSDTFADGAEGTYTTSTSEIYRQRNVHCRPSIPRQAIQSQMTTTSTSTILDSIETESVSLLTDLANNSASIQHHFIAIHPGTVTFVVTKAFE